MPSRTVPLETMASDPNQDFNISGPKHFVGTPIDWSNEHHSRIIMASLVKGVYTLNSDQNANRQGINALAPPWWMNFHFEKIKVLNDPKSSNSIFGAIFKFNPPYLRSLSEAQAPTYVIAFRGTSLEHRCRIQDLKLDFEIAVNHLHKSSRIHIAMEAVSAIIHQIDDLDINSIWLTGHSLGAAEALTIGRDLVLERNIHLQTYLFNPPCIHLPAATSSKSHHLKGLARGCRSFLIATAATIKGCDEDNSEFKKLSHWGPKMFVNPLDRICKEYIGYFQHREQMDKIGLGDIERLATQHSVASLISGTEPSHLIPVAYLTINKAHHPKQAHDLQQWWVSHQEFHWESKTYDKFWQVMT